METKARYLNGSTRRIRSGTKTPQWKVDAMQAMYLDGLSLTAIATQLDVSAETVGRYCRHLAKPQKKPLQTSEINKLLTEWRAA